MSGPGVGVRVLCCCPSACSAACLHSGLRADLLRCPACWGRLAAAVGGRAAVAAALLLVLDCSGVCRCRLGGFEPLPHPAQRAAGELLGDFRALVQPQHGRNRLGGCVQTAFDAFVRILIDPGRARHGVRHLQVLLPVALSINYRPSIPFAGHDMEYVISKSFSQFQHEQQLPELESRLKAVEAGRRLLAYPPPCCLTLGLVAREGVAAAAAGEPIKGGGGEQALPHWLSSLSNLAVGLAGTEGAAAAWFGLWQLALARCCWPEPLPAMRLRRPRPPRLPCPTQLHTPCPTQLPCPLPQRRPK